MLTIALTKDGAIRPLDEIKLDAMKAALIAHKGDVSKAASALKIGRSTMYRHLSPAQIDELLSPSA